MARLLKGTALLLGGGLVALGAVWGWAAMAPPAALPADVIIVIPAGTSVTEAAELLDREGIIRSALGFRLRAAWQGVSHRLQAGEYLFAEAQAPAEVLERLVAGDVLGLDALEVLRFVVAVVGLQDRENHVPHVQDRAIDIAQQDQAPSRALDGHLSVASCESLHPEHRSVGVASHVSRHPSA